MFMTKMRLALLACGLLATGVAKARPAVGTGHPKPEIRPRTIRCDKGALAMPSDETAAIDAMVSRDMDRLDVELLTDEVQQLKNEVQNAYRRKAQAERPEYRQTADGVRVIPRISLKDAQSDYESRPGRLYGQAPRVDHRYPNVWRWARVSRARR